MKPPGGFIKMKRKPTYTVVVIILEIIEFILSIIYLITHLLR